MNTSVRGGHEDDAHLRAVSAFERTVGRLDAIERYLHEAGSWLPGRQLLAEIAWARQRIERLEEAWGRKLVVALVGPSGAGKSTLLNALAERELSATGRQRPTTREVIIYAQSLSDSEDLARHCGTDNVRVVVNHHASGLEYLTLVDAPDTNTLPENQALLARVLEKTDLLVAVFPATNPKMHDNVAFLRPYVRSFPRDAVVPVLNKVDRVPKAELEGAVLPDFRRALAREWGLEAEPLFLTSAKSSVPGVRHPADEKPLHGIDETDGLRSFLAKYVASAGQVVDRRLARAERLADLVRAHCLEVLDASSEKRAEARAQLLQFADRTVQCLIREFQKMGEGRIKSAPSVSLYAALAARWWGPVGWLVVIWSALLDLGSAVGRILRRGNLAGRILFSGEDSGRGGVPIRKESAAQASSVVGPLFFALRQLYAGEWPPVADSLVSSGFDVTVRENAHWEEWAGSWQGGMASRWREASQWRVRFLAGRLSFWPLQVLLNAPTLALVGWVCAETLRSFFARQYLPVDYFRQALIVIVLVWVISFVALQMLVSASSGRRFYRAVTRELAEGELGLATEWGQQLDTLEELQRLCRQSAATASVYPDLWTRSRTS